MILPKPQVSPVLHQTVSLLSLRPVAGGGCTSLSMPKIKLPERSSALGRSSGKHNSVSSLALADKLLTYHLRLLCWLHFHISIVFPLTLHALYITAWPTHWYQFGSTCLVCKLSWLRFNIISLKPLWKIGTSSIWISYTYSKPAWNYSERVDLFMEISCRSSPEPGNT